MHTYPWWNQFRDPGRTVLLPVDGQVELPELSCNKHEEEDTRMFAHACRILCAIPALQRSKNDDYTDTDMTMMYLYYIAHLDGLQELWMKKIDINLPAHGIAKALAVKYDVDAADLTSILLNTYMLTGCDTVSYLYKRGKKARLPSSC